MYLGLADDGQAARGGSRRSGPTAGPGEGLTGFVACAVGACEVVRNGWTALGQRRVARYREAGRWLPRGSRKKARWEGRLRASGFKRAARSEGSWRPHRPGQEAPDQPAATPSALRPETRPSPRGGSFESHLVTWTQARAPVQGHRASRWRRIRTLSRAKVTEPFPAGQNRVSPARRHPGGRTGLRTRGGGVGRGASGSLSKRRNSPHRRLVVRSFGPALGRAPPLDYKSQKAARRRRGGGRAAGVRGDVTSASRSPCRSPSRRRGA